MRRRSWWSRLVGVVLIGLSAGSPSANAKADPALQRRASAILRQHFDTDGPGASVALVRDGQVLLQASVGLADMDAGRPLTSATLFDLASVSKQFTAAAVLLLAERGEIDLDAPLARYVSGYSLPPDGRAVTVADLLHHRSGLPEYIDAFAGDPREFARLTPAKLLRWLNAQTPEYGAGEQFAYNNTGYVMLALLVERVGGRPFAEFVAGELFAPAGMSHSHVLDRLQPVAGAAIGYGGSGVDADVSATPTRITGDGNVFSSIDELVAWTRALGNARVLSEASMRQWWTRGALDSGEPIDDDGDGYGMGWWIDEAQQRVYHDGSWSGTSTYIVHDRRRGLWAIVLSNAEDADVAAIGEALLALAE